MVEEHIRGLKTLGSGEALQIGHRTTSAARSANRAIRPKQRFQQSTRLVIVGVFLRQRYQV